MKTRISFILLTTILSLSVISCTKDDLSPGGSDDVSPTELVNTLTGGSGWQITYFFDKKDETARYGGYVFTFASDGKLTAVKGAATVSGSWSKGNDDSKSKLYINFSSPDAFEELSEDWVVLERTDTKVRLEHVSGGNGGTDLLTFERK